MDIYTVPAGGGEPVPVTRGKATDWSPVWSPDGTYLYFVSDRGGSMNLWRVAIDEASGKPLGEPEPITTPAPFLAHPERLRRRPADRVQPRYRRRRTSSGSRSTRPR